MRILVGTMYGEMASLVNLHHPFGIVADMMAYGGLHAIDDRNAAGRTWRSAAVVNNTDHQEASGRMTIQQDGYKAADGPGLPSRQNLTRPLIKWTSTSGLPSMWSCHQAVSVLA